jgi:hypothetical protein
MEKIQWDFVVLLDFDQFYFRISCLAGFQFFLTKIEQIPSAINPSWT